MRVHLVRRPAEPEAIAVRPGDVALAVAVAVLATVSAADRAGAVLDGAAYTLLVVGALALVVHRQWPLAVFAVALGTQVSYLLLGYPEGTEWLATAVALGSVAFGLGLRWAVPLAALCLLLSLSDVTDRGLAAVDAESVLVIVGLGAAVLIGVSLRTRREYLWAVVERAALAERSREDEARRLVADERLRIAREVHDVVAHAIASINVQAGVGEHVADRAPDKAREALAAIRRTSSTALDDLRSVLGTLRVAGDADHPAPAGVAEIDQIAATARDAGLDVPVSINGEQRPLPAAVDRAAHRIVQEAVTNAIKHARATRLDIVVRYLPSALEVTVTDDGVGPPGYGVSDGHGLVGMRERVEVLGGHLQLGAGDGGGFRVAARLPSRGGAR